MVSFINPAAWSEMLASTGFLPPELVNISKVAIEDTTSLAEQKKNPILGLDLSSIGGTLAALGVKVAAAEGPATNAINGELLASRGVGGIGGK